MSKLKLFSLIILIGFSTGWNSLLKTDKVEISYPAFDQAVLGSVEIIGTIEVEDFSEFQLAFSPEGAAVQSWFPINQSNQNGEDIILGIWDTTTLSDGEYSIRLIIFKEDGETVTVLVSGLRVRNYTAYSTNTPTPLPTGPNTPTPSPTIPPATSTKIPPTQFPTNPSELTFGEIQKTISRTIINVFILFILLLLFRAYQKRKHI